MPGGIPSALLGTDNTTYMPTKGIQPGTQPKSKVVISGRARPYRYVLVEPLTSVGKLEDLFIPDREADSRGERLKCYKSNEWKGKFFFLLR